MLRDLHHGKPCPYCQRNMNTRDTRLHPTRDHVIPRCRGGTAKIICCLTCNGIKADMLPEEWDGFMEANPGWWHLTRVELRLIKRGMRGLTVIPRSRGMRRIKCGGVRQGTAPAPPVIVPPALIWELT